jgi:hypothetical protein
MPKKDGEIVGKDEDEITATGGERIGVCQDYVLN